MVGNAFVLSQENKEYECKFLNVTLKILQGVTKTRGKKKLKKPRNTLKILQGVTKTRGKKKLKKPRKDVYDYRVQHDHQPYLACVSAFVRKPLARRSDSSISFCFISKYKEPIWCFLLCSFEGLPFVETG